MAGAIPRTSEATHSRVVVRSALAAVLLMVLLGLVGPIACVTSEVGLVFTEEPNDIVVARGSAFVWNCSAVSIGSTNSPNMTWFKNGQVISDGRRVVLDNGSLHIYKVIHNLRRGISDEDLYECMATNEFGSILSRPASLQVTYLNISRLTSSSQTALAGEMARFECGIHGLPRPVIYWSHNGREILPGNDSRVLILNSGVLQVYPVDFTYNGSYQCHGENDFASRSGSVHELIVMPVNMEESSSREPRFIIKPPLNTTVKSGETIQWECAVSSRDANVFWRRQDRVPLQDRARVIGRSNLELMDVDILDTSVYQCVFNTDDVIGVVLLEVIERPLLHVSKPTIIVPVGRSAELECEHSGFTTIDLTWTKDGYPVNKSRRIHASDTSLSIASVVLSDAGFYQCWADSDAGSSYAVIRLIVQQAGMNTESPSAPTNLVVQSVDSRTVLFRWTESPPRNNRSTLAYSVHYCQVSGGTELQLVTTDTSLTITQLTPNTNYSFYVLAYNEKNASPKSVYTYFKTEDGIPTAQPSVNLTVLNATSMLIEWSEVPIERARGIVTHYQIHYRKVEGDVTSQASPHSPFVTITTADALRRYVITDVVVGMVYQVLVLACTQGGCSSAEDRWTWSPKLVTYRYAPVTLHCETVNETSIQLSWAANSSKPYTVKFSFIGVTDSRALVTDDESVVVSGLEPYMEYSFTVYSLDKPLYHSVTCRTAEGFPTEPLDVQANVRKSSAANDANLVDVIVTWRPPSRCNGVVTSYTVYWSLTPDASDEMWSSTVVNGSTHTVLSVVRTESQRCYVKVSASTARGMGQWTPTVTISTIVTAGMSELEIGVIIGVSIGFICIVVCITGLILKNRYKDTNRRQSPTSRLNDTPTLRGVDTALTGRHSNNQLCYLERSELDCLTPMLENDLEALRHQPQYQTTFLTRIDGDLYANNAIIQRLVKADDSTVPLCIDLSMSFTTSNPDSPCDKSTVDVIGDNTVEPLNITVNEISPELLEPPSPDITTERS